MAIANGTYEILSLMDVTMAVDVNGSSVANSATVQLWGRNGSNTQKWQLTSQSGYWFIKNSGKSLDVQRAQQKAGTPVIMYTHSGNANQRWKVTEVGTQAVNGTSYPVVTIGAFNGTSLMLDVTGKKTAPRTVIEIWTANGGDNQRFVLVPTEGRSTGGSTAGLPTLPTPSAGAAGTSVGTASSGTIALASGTVYPCWRGSGSTYQLRYRTRTRAAGGAVGAWSNWMSISDGSTGCDGWGAPGMSNCSATDAGGRKWSPNGVAVDNSSAHDLTEIEFSVREWRAASGSSEAAHGEALTWTVRVARPVAVSDIDAALSPEGVVVSWASSATTAGNTVTIRSEQTGAQTVVGAASAATQIPMRSLARRVAEGDSVRLTVTVTTPDGLSASRTETVALSYQSGHGSGLSLSASVAGTVATVTASDPSARLWLVVPRGHGTRYVEVPGSSPWKVAPPLGVPWTAYAAVGGTTWRSVTQEFPAIADGGYHVTSQDCGTDLAIYHNLGRSPEFSPRYARSSRSMEVMGRERPVNALGSSTAASWTLKGAVHGSTLDEGVALADWAAHAGHVYFRAPNGFWAQALASSAEVDLSTRASGFVSVSLGFDEEVW